MTAVIFLSNITLSSVELRAPAIGRDRKEARLLSRITQRGVPRRISMFLRVSAGCSHPGSRLFVQNARPRDPARNRGFYLRRKRVSACSPCFRLLLGFDVKSLGARSCRPRVHVEFKSGSEQGDGESRVQRRSNSRFDPTRDPARSGGFARTGG